MISTLYYDLSKAVSNWVMSSVACLDSCHKHGFDQGSILRAYVDGVFPL